MLSRFKFNLLAKSQEVSRDSLRLLLLVRMYETHFHHTEIWMWETRNCCLYSRRQIMRAVLLFVCPMTPIEVESLLLIMCAYLLSVSSYHSISYPYHT